jgi:hypothetical protein
MKRKPGEHAREASKRRRKAKQAAVLKEEDSMSAIAEPEHGIIRSSVQHITDTSSLSVGVAEEHPPAQADDDDANLGSAPECLTRRDDDVGDNNADLPEIKNEQQEEEDEVKQEGKEEGTEEEKEEEEEVKEEEKEEKEEEEDISTPPPLHFYLLKPSTTTSQKVLIPLHRNATLTSCLRDRTVLEFPTIYVLPHAPASLPAEDYILEEQYLRTLPQEVEKEEKEGGEKRELLMRASGARASGEKGGTSSAAEKEEKEETAAPSCSARAGGAPVNAKSILDVLKRDMTR